jgi:hypothetical protein
MTRHLMSGFGSAEPDPRSKEDPVGFRTIEAPDLDVALRLAVEGLKTCHGAVEVGPFAAA